MALALEDCAPIATTPHIGAWVERIAYADLAARTKLIAELESANIAPTLEQIFDEIRGIDECTVLDEMDYRLETA